MSNAEQARNKASFPDGAPYSTDWRRERLMRLGSNHTSSANLDEERDVQADESLNASTESTSLRPTYSQTKVYGTTGNVPRRRGSLNFSFGSRRHSPELPKGSVEASRIFSVSTPATPTVGHSILRSRMGSERPISAYDKPYEPETEANGDVDAKINGVRVWYSSFSSIDWLHDAIKDAARFSRLRRRKSVRARIRLAFDKSLGWIIVTIVGFLTALAAFLIIRTEQVLFDLKEGYCGDNWLLAQRFCCPSSDDAIFTSRPPSDTSCPAWRSWPEVFHSAPEASSSLTIEFASYIIIALILACVSSILTIYLTNSTTFLTRKESGVLAPHFSSPDRPMKVEPKRKTMYYAAGSGIPEIKTILSGFVIHGYLGGRVLFTKSVGLAMSVASGLSLGKEGPFVHIASCIGNIVSRIASKYENNEAKRREILSAACAAGVAVAFGAPIGGTLFSLEEVSFYFPPKVMWRSFFCAMIAAITLKVLDPFGTGKLVLFQVTYDKDWHGYELLPFLILGIFGGVYGAYFSKLNYRWSRHVRNATWLARHPIVEVFLVTLITTCLCFLNDFTQMGGTELVYKLFEECHPGSVGDRSGLCVVDPGSFSSIWPVIKAIGVAMIVKGALTVITFGIKLPAGIFIPSLGVGACAGRILGLLMQWLQHRQPDSMLFRSCNGDLNCIIPGLYAMVGAAATLSGVTRTTVSLAVIMFELTDTLTYAVPVMLSVLVAKTVADALEPKGIYDLVIELSQLPYLDVKEEYVWGHLKIEDVTDRDVETIQLGRSNTVESLRDQLQNGLASGNDDVGFPILRTDENDSDGLRMVGYIGANELEHALSIVADTPEEQVSFGPASMHLSMASSVSSLLDGQDKDHYDFSIYMDQAPLTIQSNSPLEMVHQFFTKLGARYIVITDTEGLYEGVIDKKTWLAFLSGLDEK